MDLLNFLDGGSALPFSSKEVTTTLSPSFCLSPRFFPSPNLVAINSFAAANDDEVRLTNKDKKDDDDDHDRDDGDDSDERSASSSSCRSETAIEKASVVCSPSMHTLLFAQESLEASNGSMTGVNPSSVTPSSPGGGGGGTSIFAALSSSAQPRPSPSRSPGPTPTIVPTRSTPASSKTTTVTTTTTTTASGGSTRAAPMVTLPPSSCSAAEDPCGTGRGEACPSTLGGSLSCARSKGGVVVPITHPPSRTTLRVVSSPSTAPATAGKMASGGGREGRASRYGVGAAGTSTSTGSGSGASSANTRRGHGGVSGGGSGGGGGGGVVSSSAAAKDVIVDVKPVTLADLEEEELKRARNRASAAGSRLKRKAEHESLKAAKDRLEAERLERERITTEALAENEALRKEVAYLRSLLHHASPLAGLLATLAPSSSALSSSSSALAPSPAPLSCSSSSSSSQCVTQPSGLVHEGRLKRKYSGGFDNESGTPPSASVCVTVNASGGFTLETCSECSLRATGGGGRVAHHQHGGIVSGSLMARQHPHHHHHHHSNNNNSRNNNQQHQLQQQQQQDDGFIKSEYFDGTKGHSFSSSREEGEEEEEEEEEVEGRVTKRARLTAHASSISSSSSSLSLSHGTPSSG